MDGQTTPEIEEDEVENEWFENFYECLECGISWSDEWSCQCDDRCPECDAETVPTRSVDLSQAPIDGDYAAADDLMSLHITASFNLSPIHASTDGVANLEIVSDRSEQDPGRSNESLSEQDNIVTQPG